MDAIRGPRNAVAVGAVALAGLTGLAGAISHPAKAQPYTVQIYGAHVNEFFKCRKLVHVPPFYGFTGCKRFILWPPPANDRRAH